MLPFFVVGRCLRGSKRCQQAFDAFGEGCFDLVRLARCIAAQRGHGAPRAKVVTMLPGQVVINELRWIDAGRFRHGLRDGAGCRLGHQVGFGSEMLVEPAVGKACRSHQIGHPDTVIAMLAKLDGRRLDDVCPVGLGLRLGNSHAGCLFACLVVAVWAWKSVNIALMLTVIKTADRQDVMSMRWLKSNRDLRLRVESVSVFPAFFFVTRKLRLAANLSIASLARHKSDERHHGSRAKSPNADGQLAPQENTPCIERKLPQHWPFFAPPHSLLRWPTARPPFHYLPVRLPTNRSASSNRCMPFMTRCLPA
ncbi:hypothetical protein ALP23_05355 [Pseudomonas syringae pv. apii]|uniref:Uncharacterized protein n=1 Tax=Pseudomonas syringae pv. apii TaxID=81036 RepID=A0A3M5WLX1_9PSED|nr:hypothetical protein ALP23_05355 [Pseudomonas syringae pv. apii]